LEKAKFNFENHIAFCMAVCIGACGQRIVDPFLPQLAIHMLCHISRRKRR
jgi:hypothetical protein